MQQRFAIATMFVAALGIATSAADAQSLGDRLKKRASEAAKRTAEQKVDQKATQATNAALDKAENTIKCATSDTACQDKAKSDGKTVVIDDSAPKGGAPAAAAASTSAASASSANSSSATASDTAQPKEEAAFVNFVELDAHDHHDLRLVIVVVVLLLCRARRQEYRGIAGESPCI